LKTNRWSEEGINKLLAQIWSAHEKEIKDQRFGYDSPFFNMLY
jgi:hypothetical protein